MLETVNFDGVGSNPTWPANIKKIIITVDTRAVSGTSLIHWIRKYDVGSNPTLPTKIVL